MTTRTKIALCAGLLAVAVGVAVVVWSPAKPSVELKFVRYTNLWADTWAVLGITNHGACAITAYFNTGGIMETGGAVAINGWLPGRSGTQFVARPWTTISVQYWHEGFFDTLIGIASSQGDAGKVVSVVLPPRGSNAPAQPLTP